jgi:hypothetical protein
MKKQNQALQRQIKPHGLTLRNGVGHGAAILDGGGRVVAKVHLEDDRDVRQAMQLLRRRGALTT